MTPDTNAHDDDAIGTGTDVARHYAEVLVEKGYAISAQLLLALAAERDALNREIAAMREDHIAAARRAHDANRQTHDAEAQRDAENERADTWVAAATTWEHNCRKLLERLDAAIRAGEVMQQQRDEALARAERAEAELAAYAGPRVLRPAKEDSLQAALAERDAARAEAERMREAGRALHAAAVAAVGSLKPSDHKRAALAIACMDWRKAAKETGHE